MITCSFSVLAKTFKQSWSSIWSHHKSLCMKRPTKQSELAKRSETRFWRHMIKYTNSWNKSWRSAKRTTKPRTLLRWETGATQPKTTWNRCFMQIRHTAPMQKSASKPSIPCFRRHSVCQRQERHRDEGAHLQIICHSRHFKRHARPLPWRTSSFPSARSVKKFSTSMAIPRDLTPSCTSLKTRHWVKSIATLCLMTSRVSKNEL